MINLNAANEESHQMGATLNNPDGGTAINPEPFDVVHVDPFDTVIAKAKFANYKAEIKGMLEKANSHQIIDNETNMMAVEMATQSKRLYNEIEKLRKNITDEPRKFTSAINNFAKVFTVRLKEIENIFKSQISSYAHKVEMARREAEKKAQEEAKKLQAKIDKEAKEKNIEPVQVATPVLSAKPEPTRTESGSASVRKSWKWKEADMAKVPLEYLMLDKVKINKAVKAGLREISGLEIYEESQTVLRT